MMPLQKNAELDELETLWRQEQERRAKEESAAEAEAAIADTDDVHLKVPNLRNSLRKISAACGVGAGPKGIFVPPAPNTDIQSRPALEDADTPREPPPPPPIDEGDEEAAEQLAMTTHSSTPKDAPTPPLPSAHEATEDRNTPKHAPPPVPNKAIEGLQAEADAGDCKHNVNSAASDSELPDESGGKGGAAADRMSVLNLVDSFMDDSQASDDEDIWVRRSAFTSREPLTAYATAALHCPAPATIC